MNWIYIFLGFSLLIVLHEGGHYLAAKATGMRVERFFLFFGPTLWSFKRGETEYGIKSIPLGGYVKITGMSPEEEIPEEVSHRAYYRQPVWKRIVVIAAGPAVNVVLAFLIFTAYYHENTARYTQAVGETVAGKPAAEVLEPGDEIVAVDGRSFVGLDTSDRLEEFRDQVASHECAGRQTDGCAATTPVELTIIRDGRERTVMVTPEYDKAARRTLVGFTYGTEREPVSYGAAAGSSLDAMGQVVTATGSVFARIFESEKRKELSGVVGVSDVANQTIEVGVWPSLLLLGLVSLSLGLINLLPFLPLDGGHIFWSLVEKARGEPVPLKVMERATAVGFALVAVLFFIGLSNDIGRLGTDYYPR
ncbi:MAG: site-2 protease family protein [Solirubrobacterales bacterium]